MRVVHKFYMPVGAINLHDIPAGACLLTVQLQDGKPFMWAELDDAAPKVRRRFEFFGTGRPIPNGWVYVGTVQEGAFVWHLYEVKEGAL